jgi:hypothetical protein
MIKSAEEEQVFTAGEAGVKAEVTAGMKAEIAPDVPWGLDGVVTGDAGTARRGKKKRREDTEESGFAGAVGAEQRDGFAFANGKGDVFEGRNGRAFERLKKSAPAAASGREKLYQRLDGDRGIGHGEVITRPETRNNLPELPLASVKWTGRSCTVTGCG